MHLDVDRSQGFLRLPTGPVVRELLGPRLRARWSDGQEPARTFGLGFATPYLAAFRSEA